jgi:hypothetical protein
VLRTERGRDTKRSSTSLSSCNPGRVPDHSASATHINPVRTSPDDPITYSSKRWKRPTSKTTQTTRQTPSSRWRTTRAAQATPTLLRTNRLATCQSAAEAKAEKLLPYGLSLLLSNSWKTVHTQLHSSSSTHLYGTYRQQRTRI